MSPTELLELYFFGVPLCTIDGRTLSNEVIKQKIIDAQNNIESTFSIKLLPYIVDEEKDFIRKDFEDWGYLKTTFQIVQPYDLKGFINDVQQIQYPIEWQSVNNKNDGRTYFRNIYIVPNTGGTTGQGNFVYSGISPHLGWFGAQKIPNYWRIKYRSGYDDPNKVSDLYDVVGKIAAIPLLAMLGDVLIGLGVSSQSLSMDGLSQSISTIKSAQGGIFAGRIKMYLEDLKMNFKTIETQYKGILFEVF